jgi:filamentous hemagglutinin
LDDFKDVSDDVRKEILDNPDLVDEWKAINDAPSNPSKGGKPEWLRRLQEGNDFNKERSSFYTHNEIYVEKPGGKGYYRLDSYNPGKEIVSRKYTQLADIEEVTGAKYVQELKAKYPPGAKVANVPSNKAGGANKGLESSIGKGIVGDLVLEIPVQKAPIPQSVINEANKLLITIRDVNGKAYN